LALSLGDARDAERQLAPLVEVIWRAGIREPGFMRAVPDEVEALIMLDESARALVLLDPFEREARRLDRAWALAAAARCRAMLAAADGRLEEAERAFAESLGHHERLGEPFDLARTLLAQGVVQRRAKQRRAARETLQRALALFEELGAAIWAERARAELARIGGRAPSAGELTPMERRVADLVAAGRSNREIAAELVVTARTVETHLSRIYRKLGLRSRTELAARVTEEALTRT
jgi:DNA-binding CsgD family transcriptional regulator